MRIDIRRAEVPADADAIRAISTSVETGEILSIKRRPDGFALVEEATRSPIVKTFPLDDLDDEHRWDSAWLAFDAGTPAGFIATEFDEWNRRTVVWHFYVAHAYRGRGVGRQLMEVALAAGRKRGATRAWAETSNVNAPGVAAYRRLGFEVVGFDLSLYDNTPAAGEVAIFLSRELR